MPRSVHDETPLSAQWRRPRRVAVRGAYAWRLVPVLLVIAIAMIAAACGGNSRPAPKDTIFALFSAMRGSDSTAIRSLVDLESAFQSVTKELPPPADSTLLQDHERWLLSEMTDGGSLHRRWLDDYQIVIGRSDVEGDTAYVEVSFIDRVTRVQYYNKMQLVFQDGRWLITRFRTM